MRIYCIGRILVFDVTHARWAARASFINTDGTWIWDARSFDGRSL